MSDNLQILVTAEEFSRIQELATRCEAMRLGPYDPWPDGTWRAGLEEIIGWRAVFSADIKTWVIKVRQLYPDFESRDSSPQP